MKTKLIVMIFATALISSSCKKEGCTDPLAENYEKKATEDDGSCTYPPDVISQEITEDITTPTTIEAKNIKICDDISITAEVTILPGATLIMCANASITVEETGSLSAVGTAEKPIVIRGETETKGFWEGLAFLSNNPNNKLIYTTVKDAGTYWGWENATVFVNHNGKLEMSNSTIANSDNVGLFVAEGGSLGTFSQNKFSNNTLGLSLPVNQVSKLDAGSVYNDNNTNGFIFAQKGTIGVEAVWQALPTPLLLEGVTLEAGLTLNEGSLLWMESNSYIDVRPTGFFKSNGTAANPIKIKGRYTSPAYWEGMYIQSNNPNNVMTHTTVEDGGAYWGYSYANIAVKGRLDISNSTITNANSWGIYVESSASIYTNGTVQTTAAGVEASNTFSSNGSGPDANCTSGCSIFFD